MVKKSFKYIIGVDEVGRGPLAGPVTVCALCICKNSALNQKTKFTMVNFKNFKDSKKLSHKQRLIWLEKIDQEKKKGNIFYHVSCESNLVIDTKGLTFAINRALSNSLKKIKIIPSKSLVLLDGGLKAPKKYKNQKTIIKGDEKELVIALASVVAKVNRDNLMLKLAKKYPGYALEKHKGYGTTAHYIALKNKGLTAIHRKSFCKKVV